jgi:hypothetical protein
MTDKTNTVNYIDHYMLFWAVSHYLRHASEDQTSWQLLVWEDVMSHQVDETVAELRTRSGAADPRAAWAAGRALSLDEAIGLAIEPEPAAAGRDNLRD